MRTDRIHGQLQCLVFALALLASSVLFSPVEAAYGRMHKAVELLTKAQSAPFASDEQQKLLNSGLKTLQSAFDKGPGTQKAIGLVNSAVADVKGNDATKFNEDIGQAIAAANAVMVGGSEAPAGAAPSSTPASSAKLSDDQARAVVLIKGDSGEGTGFLIQLPGGPTVVTNIHVISNNPNLKILTTTGSQLTMVSCRGAVDRDLAMITVKDDPSLSFLSFASDLANTVQPGDEVITPGNSEGGGVVLNTDGKVLGLGPDRVEFNNPIYHGNSGGPIFHVKSGKVIGVVSEAMRVVNSDALDKASFASRNSAISGTMRYFGFRIDNVPDWQTYDWNQFQTETAFLEQFEKRNRCLDSYLNTPAVEQQASHEKNRRKKKSQEGGGAAPDSGGGSEDAEFWQQDAKLVKANNDFIQQTAGADTSQQMNAFRELYGSICDVARLDLNAIQNTQSFYAFDQRRAKDELAYRKALLTELDMIGSNVSRMGSMPRTNK